MKKELAKVALGLLFALPAFAQKLSPIPEDPSELVQAERASEEGLFLDHRLGHILSIFNNNQKGSPLASDEDMAFVRSCAIERITPGEVRIEMSPYWAGFQNGGGGQLTCELMPLSHDWVYTFNSSAQQCLNRAGAKIGWGQPDGAVLTALMAYTHKGSGERLSLHSAARALDISRFELDFNNDIRRIEVSQASLKASPDRNRPTPERVFLTEFRQCWSEALEEVLGCEAYSTQPRGSVGWEDASHQNHLHLSAPYCPKNPHFYGG